MPQSPGGGGGGGTDVSVSASSSASSTTGAVKFGNITSGGGFSPITLIIVGVVAVAIVGIIFFLRSKK
jgi:hypothetical protein